MKVLIVLPYLPYPFLTGGRVRMYNLIKHLAGRHEITLLCYLRSPQDNEHVAQVAPHCRAVETVLRRPARSAFNAAVAAFSRYPMHAVVNGFSREMEGKIRAHCATGSYDLVHVEHYHMAQPVLKVRPRLPRLLGEQGVEFLVYERHFRAMKNPLLRAIGLWEARRMRAYEVRVIRQFDVCLEVSEEDVALIRPWVPEGRFEAVPNGVDTATYRPWDGTDGAGDEPGCAQVVFVGGFSFFANRDAVRYLRQEIMPLVWARHAEAKVWVIGADPPRWAREMASDRFVVTGYLPLEEYRRILGQAALLVAPLRSGSGIKLKVLEALAMAKPVVATSVGWEGIEGAPEAIVLRADDPAAFAAQMLRLLSDGELRQRLGQVARQFVASRYDWAPIADKLSGVYEQTVARWRELQERAAPRKGGPGS